MCWGLTPTLCPSRGTAEYITLCKDNFGVTSNGEGENLYLFVVLQEFLVNGLWSAVSDTLLPGHNLQLDWIKVT